ncbi:Cyanate hydratase [Coemansia biformis]|uniref:Cyanate hydratase n=1 Tax=Coemansia biformis TaxID=1286918 RepID=A0A9W8D089_9FUNG|nr:Cyanate hydratase [Coemansia biformis]
MNRVEDLPQACAKLLHEKARRRLSFAEIAKHLDHDEVWTAALFYGRAAPTHKDILLLASLLSLSAETLEDDFRMAGPPLREPSAAASPAVAPFCDAISLYAPAIRSVIVEKMGDGAVCGPSTKVRVERIDRAAGDGERAKGSDVRLILEAKYMPYRSW